jgi:hypothetical protein
MTIVSATMVISVETSYPVPADAAVGLLYMFANATAVAMTLIGQVLLGLGKVSTPPFFPYGIWIIVLFSLSLIPILSFKGENKRMLVEK